MDPSKDGHRGSEADCPVCGERFWQRVDGRPRTCSRSCARRLDWTRRPPPAHRWVNRQGYVLVAAPEGYEGKAYRMSGRSRVRYVLEHRLVMERTLGRTLDPHETVHHRNGRRDDNRPENLELRVSAHGRGATEPHCPTCRCFG